MTLNLRRFNEHKPLKKPIVLREDHPAVTGGGTLFPSSVKVGSFKVLKSGFNSRKIGKEVVKGRWNGMPIFTLTLEERATCPRSCLRWRDCYGNHMHWAHRQEHGKFLEQQLARELKCLQWEYPHGFVVRLHVLGDFYRWGYVKLWYNWMLDLPALHVFGFTAHRPESKMGALIARIHERFPKRWWIRHSDADDATWMSTGESGIICPMQQGKTDCCGTCGLCWTAKKPIRFLPH